MRAGGKGFSIFNEKAVRNVGFLSTELKPHQMI